MNLIQLFFEKQRKHYKYASPVCKILLLVLVAFFSFEGMAQIKSYGIPSIQNYTKSQYKAGTQNWDIIQDENGFMYFANNQGVLRFDGIHWDLIKVSESSPVRSVGIDQQNTIYAGLFNDFGVLHPNSTGKLVFKSLRYLLPPEIEGFDNIWNIHEIPQGIVFQSFSYLFIYNGEEMRIIKPEDQFHFSFNVGNRLFVHEPELGLHELLNDAVQSVPGTDELVGKEVWGILEIDEDSLLIGTNNDGIYIYTNEALSKWETPANEFVEQSQLFSVSPLNDEHFAFGTVLNGIIVSNKKGEVVQHITIDSGLQNNTVLSIFSDNSQNLWLGLDNGIDYIEINSPITFNSDFGKIGTGYASRIFDDKIYLGTNQGLFVRQASANGINNEDFKLVKNTTGQVWSLGVFDGQLICGHNSGTFKIEDDAAVPVSQEDGAWGYIVLNNSTDLLLGGHYNGLSTLKKIGDGWEFGNKIKGFNESSRFLAQDSDGNVWVSHGSKGVYRIRLNAALDSAINVRLYTSEHGLPSDEHNILFKYNTGEYVSTTDGIFEYRSETDNFTLNERLTQFFNFQGQVKTIEVDDMGNIWFIADRESGVFRKNEDLTYTKITLPFKPLDDRYVNGFEFIYPYNNEFTLFGIDNGFALYSSMNSKQYARPLKAFITQVELPYIDSTLYLLNRPNEDIFKFPFNKNAVRFHYTAPFFEQQEQTEFSFLLENYDDEWSSWSDISFKDFTSLPFGDYVFNVKARNLYDVESDVSTFAFRIMPPWHKTAVAKYSFVLLFIGLIALILKFVVYRMELSEKRVVHKHRTELALKEEKFQLQKIKDEKEIIKLRNEKLQDEMLFKNKELANQTMGIIQKNQFLVNLKDELVKIQKSSSDEKIKKRLSGLSRNINKEIDNKQQNQVFETYFDEVHKDFFEQLKIKYPELTPRDMRLCAYIRMNLTSKEIAALLNISDRGVEISRYRLRKKMELSRDINLSTFLSNI